ncbi:cytochrome b N-terminal domain-containing protein [Carboxylicivirga mesophila]|uniref:Cytochrome b N-terminal domain-containing protein n=1 Tax=Carboxylicivirga mesophila TaxID=1166478 RepID=A0ABS5KDR2_9BACT|nr:cytochrome b N-terminal domain-containing protein [Carboxylicivirga mesophila]MBS2212942.1 cytochrome b N-terminal domain-containing protein [Carboxylicivirga mesophila]
MNEPATQKAITRFLLHLHPPRVNSQSIKYTRTFGLGGIAALLFVLLFITGMLLRFIYVPSEKGAYDSISYLQNEVFFGQLLRNMHYWCGMLLVVVSFLHVIRVFYSQSIYNERRKNWLYGLLIMFLVIMSNFTGYLLPWDQLAYWAVTIMTNMLSYIPVIGDGLATLVRGGAEVNEGTLLRFYHFHTGLLPLLMVFTMSIHFWLVRKAKGVTVADSSKKEMVNTNPELVYKEIVVALSLILLLIAFSMLVDAPLLDKANPLESPNPSKAPWYFMGFQELLLHMHPGFGIFIVPVLVTAFLIYIPYVKGLNANVGVWFNSAVGKQVTIWSAIYAIVFTTLMIVGTEYFFKFQEWMVNLPVLITAGLVPFIIYILPTYGFILFIQKKLKAGKMEVLISLVTILLTAYLVMTIVGSLLRGEGMHLFA